MSLLEIEKTYLAKCLPDDVLLSPFKDIIDIFITISDASTIRLRKSGEEYTLTKKIKEKENDASSQMEFTIPLDESEFLLFEKMSSKVIEKRRYFYRHERSVLEIDIFTGHLKGLVIIECEFRNRSEYNAFIMPEFCLIEVTQENFIAGKFLAGKSIKDLESDFKRLNYVIINS